MDREEEVDKDMDKKIEYCVFLKTPVFFVLFAPPSCETEVRRTPSPASHASACVEKRRKRFRP